MLLSFPSLHNCVLRRFFHQQDNSLSTNNIIYRDLASPIHRQHKSENISDIRMVLSSHRPPLHKLQDQIDLKPRDPSFCSSYRAGVR